MQTKDFKLELKSVGDDGTFEGYLSVYGVVDLGNDVVEKGAFTKTINDNKGMVPLLNNHNSDQDMGLLYLSDDERGLKVRGEMFTAQSPLAAERHAMAKRYHEAGRPVGLSIGYETIRKVLDKGIRRLKEVKLYEGSMTLFPMLPVAQLTGIKSRDGGKADDFLAELDEAQTMAMRYMMMSAIGEALCDILYDQTMSADDKVTASDESIQQFRTSYTEFLPKLLASMGEDMGAMEMASQKVGRVLSASNLSAIKEAVQKLQALIDSVESTSTDAADNTDKSAANPKPAPESDLHSWLSESLSGFQSQLSAIATQ